MSHVLTRPPRLNRIVHYWDATSKSERAQIAAITNNDVVTLRFGDGRIIPNVVRASSSAVALKWGYIRPPKGIVLTVLSLFTPVEALSTGLLKAWYEAPDASAKTLVTDDFTRVAAGPVVKVSDTFTRSAVVSDDFSEANGTALNGKVTDTGQAWIAGAAGSSVATIQNGKVTSVSGQYSTGKNHVVETGLSDVVVAGTSTYEGNDNYMLLRYSDDSNYIYYFQGTIAKVVAGVTTTIATNFNARTGAITLRAIGNSITFTDGPSATATATDSFNATATKHGLTISRGPGAVNPSSEWDDFSVTRADLGTSTTGHTWTEDGGDWGIDSTGKAYALAGANKLAVVESGMSDADVSVTINMNNVNVVPGIVMRYADTSNYLHVYITPTAVRLDKVVAGVGTLLASPVATYAAASDIIVRFIAVGSRLIVMVDGAERINLIDAAGSTNTKHGIRTDGTVPRFDNFSISSPATGVTDNFSEADGTTLNGKATDTGQVWSVLSGAWTVTSGKLGNPGSFNIHAVIESALTDVAIQTDINSTGWSALVARVTDSSNLYQLDTPGPTGGTANLFKKVAGVFTALGSFTPTSLTSYNAQLRCIGNSLVVLVDGSSLLSVTDSTYTTQTKHGLAGPNSGPASATGTFDNFSVTRADLGSATGLNGAKVPWVEYNGADWGVDAAGKAYRIGTTNADYFAALTGTANGAVSIGLSTAVSVSAEAAGIVFRGSDLANHWRVVVDNTSCYLQKTVAGTKSTVQTVAQVFVSGDVLSVDFVGSTIKMYRNGSQIGTTVTDAFNSTATLCGIADGGAANAARLDDFSIKTPALAAGDPISSLPDLSGNNNHAVQTTAANQPKYGFGTVTDDFNRANGPVGTATTGQAWNVGMQISNGQASSPGRVAILETGMPDAIVSTDIIHAAQAGNLYGPAFRASDQSNFWIVDTGATLTVNLYKSVGGAFTLVAGGGASGAEGSTENFTVEMKGSVISVRKNGVTQVTATDSFNSTATKHGLQTNSNFNVRFDNFSVKSLANGKPVAVFDGVNDLLSSILAASITGPQTAFLVARNNSVAAGSFIDGQAVGTLLVDYGGNTRFYTNALGTVINVTTPARDTNTHIFSMLVNNVGSLAAIDGASTTGTLTPSTISTLNVGSRTAAGDPLDGQIAAVLIFQGALSYADRKKVEFYLQDKYATPALAS